MNGGSYYNISNQNVTTRIMQKYSQMSRMDAVVNSSVSALFDLPYMPLIQVGPVVRLQVVNTNLVFISFPCALRLSLMAFCPPSRHHFMSLVRSCQITCSDRSPQLSFI